MADIKVDQRGEHGPGPRRTNWPLWLLVPLGIFGIVAVIQLDERRDETRFNRVPDSTVVDYRGVRLSNAGAVEVAYPDEEMVRVGASANGVILYRHRSQPWAGGGGGAPSTTNPLYMQTGRGTYLPLKPIGGGK